MPKTYSTAKPYEGYPLTPRADGRFQKKIRRKLHYFGHDGDHAAALAEYLDVRDDLHAGRTPRQKGDVGPTVAGLLTSFLQAKQRQRDGSELSPKTFVGYHRNAKRIILCLGRSRSIADLRPEDFARLRVEFSKTLGPAALGVALRVTKSAFKHGYDVGMYDRPIRFGPEFKAPPQRLLRKQKAQNGKKLFTREEIHRLLDAASAPMKAMILLACNCGFGNTDCSELPLSAVDLENGWIDFSRPKTGIGRRCPLWPETIDAIQKALNCRPIPRSLEDADQVFLSPTGLRLVHVGKSGNAGDALAGEFKTLKKKVNINGATKRGFYTFRHVFRTVADGALDQPSIDLIMGHSRHDMASHYREQISDERLRKVVDHVRTWLYGTGDND